MFSRTEVEELVRRERTAAKPVLSVYLDWDQSKAINLNAKFNVSLKDMLRSIERDLREPELSRFSAVAERANAYVSEIVKPSGKGIVLFFDGGEQPLWERILYVPLRNSVRWNDEPHVGPLIALLDEYERYSVVLVDKQRGRLFTIYMGEIVEHDDALAPLPVRRVKSSDRILSDDIVQNKAATHVHAHLKNVSELLDKLHDQYQFDRILVGGTGEATSELQNLLSKRVSSKVTGHMSLPLKADTHEVLSEGLKVIAQIERRFEEEIVQELITGGDGIHPTRTGLEPTVDALREKRIWRMIYASGFVPKGGQCTNCGALFARAAGDCEYCGAAIVVVNDLLEHMVERALASDCDVEEVHGSAATRLEEAGGIGAVLRF